MKRSDINRLHELGLITADQQQTIIQTLKLKEDGNKLLLVLSVLGAVLVVAGIILLISANWENIPRGVKIAVGLVLMLGAYGGGWYLRETQGLYRKTGEALYLVGASLWLGNIALVGQIYHLSARPPNAILLWAVGIAALPWILRSAALFVLSLLAVSVWLGTEVNQHDSWLGGAWEQSQFALYGLWGLLVLGAGYAMRRGAGNAFAGAAERFGLLVLLVAAYPFCWKYFGGDHDLTSRTALGVLAGLTVLSLGLIGFGLRRPALELTPQWRWTWGIALVGLAAMFWAWMALGHWGDGRWGFHWLACVLVFGFCLLQVEVGVALRSPFMINLAIVFMALVILAAYLSLFGSMATTGWVFVLSGVFLMGLGIYLEQKRRRLLARLQPEPVPANP